MANKTIRENSMRLEGKTALVTGGASGFGAGITRKFVSEGARVAIADINPDAAAKLASELGDNAFAVTVDVSRNDSVAAMAKTVFDRFGGGLDILVNNAGITKDGLFVRMSDDAWDQVLEVNLTAVFRLTRELAHPMMKRRHGRIINITSVVGVSGNPGQANYCASKAGMIGFSKSLAQEIAPRNITVNCVAPGFIESAMTEKLNDKQKDAIMGAIPMRRMGTGAEIASAVTYLASNEASYVTGQTIHVNGGMLMV
jgi:3-oxoacyl-[acyl-carrier protein] reductase